MSKLTLTKNIEKALASYSPANFGDFEFNYRRNRYIQYEVPVIHAHIESGLVDCVWLVEGFNNHKEDQCCQAGVYLANSTRLGRKRACSCTDEELMLPFNGAVRYCDKYCFYNRVRKTKEETVAVICFEIKISKADFKSKNGHNFAGNLNYYVMPYALYQSVKDDIPEDIGVITYHSKDEESVGRLRHTKLSAYNAEIDYGLYTGLLHTCLNKSDKYMHRVLNQLVGITNTVVAQYNVVVTDLIDKLRKASLKVDRPGCFTNNTSASWCANYSSCKECKDCLFGLEYVARTENKVKALTTYNNYVSNLYSESPVIKTYGCEIDE